MRGLAHLAALEPEVFVWGGDAVYAPQWSLESLSTSFDVQVGLLLVAAPKFCLHPAIPRPLWRRCPIRFRGRRRCCCCRRRRLI